MIWLHLPWLLLPLLLVFLCMVFVREFFFALSFPVGHPERGMAFFNSSALVIAVILALLGGHFLYLHEHSFEDVFPLYPASRYAPEREVFAGGLGETWIYVSSSTIREIVNYYHNLATTTDLNIIADTSSTSSPKLLFTTQHRKIFLTIQSEGDKSVLFYSEAGEMRTVSVPSAVR